MMRPAAAVGRVICQRSLRHLSPQHLCLWYLLLECCPTCMALLMQAVMKHMLKSFKPSEDRFEGLATEASEVSGAPILLDGAAYLECTVSNRLEAGDHFVVYATIDSGKVLDEEALSSVHHRKAGTNY